MKAGLDDRPAVAVPPSAGRPGTRVPPSLFAALGGLALALSFPPYGWWPLAPLAVTVLVLACRGRSLRAGAGLGAVFGLIFFAVLLRWLRVVGTDAWLVVTGVQAVYLAGLGVALAAVSRLRAWPLWAACAFVAEEAVRDRAPLGGFPWGRLAFAAASTPYTGLAAVGGAPLVSFAVASTGTLLAYAVVLRHASAGPDTAPQPHTAPQRHVPARPRSAPQRRRLARAVAGVGGALTLLVIGLSVPLPTAGERVGGVAAARVGVVQGNVPRSGLDAFGQRSAVLRNHVAETLRLAATNRRLDAVVWPENSTDIDPLLDPEARALIHGAVAAVGVPTLVGAVLDAGPTHVRNTGLVWDPVTGPGQAYTKRHPVPFGEYVPLRSVLGRWIGRLALVPRDFVRGSRPGVLQLGPVRLGDVICFEIAYDGVVRDAVRSGGRVLVVQTNNATYGRTGQPPQQLAMSRLRAVEHGRAVLVAATSGISAVIGPDGRILDRSREFTADSLVASVPLRDSRTLADRLGAAPEIALALLGLAAALTGSRRRR